MYNTKLIKLNSDNFQNQLMTIEAYQEVRLQMSTGDFHTHKAQEVDSETLGEIGFDQILTLDDVLN